MKKLSIVFLFVSIALAGVGMFNNFVSAQDSEEDKKTSAKVKPKSEEELVKAINTMLEAAWKEDELKPSAPAKEGEWLRRVYLDTVGRTPTLDEALAFFKDKDSKKRDAVIDKLLASNEHAANWSGLWGKELVGSNMRKRGSGNLQLWLRSALMENTPYDEMTREILTASGDVVLGKAEPTPGGYFVSFDNNTVNLASNISRVFLGIEIQCAQCHDHRTEKWKQTDFFGFAAIFKATKTRRKSNNRESEDYNTYVVSDARVGKMSKRKKRELEKKAQANPEIKEKLLLVSTAPKFLEGEELTDASNGGDLREDLAQWVTDKSNPYFARTVVNRMWGHYFKRGFVEPVDDFSSVNEPSHPELLKLLADDFAANGYDLRRLERVMLKTRSYQLSSDLSPNNQDDLLWYSRAFLEQLSAEQLFNSILSATGAQNAADKAGKARFNRLKGMILRQFTTIFEDDEDKDSESFTGTIPQALLMMNGDFIAKAAAAFPGNTLFTIFEDYEKPEERIETMYIAALTRKPNSSEKERMMSHLKSEGGTVAAYEDIFWALLNSAEFLNNH